MTSLGAVGRLQVACATLFAALALGIVAPDVDGQRLRLHSFAQASATGYSADLFRDLRDLNDSLEAMITAARGRHRNDYAAALHKAYGLEIEVTRKAFNRTVLFGSQAESWFEPLRTIDAELGDAAYALYSPSAPHPTQSLFSALKRAIGSAHLLAFMGGKLPEHGQRLSEEIVDKLVGLGHRLHKGTLNAGHLRDERIKIEQLKSELAADLNRDWKRRGLPDFKEIYESFGEFHATINLAHSFFVYDHDSHHAIVQLKRARSMKEKLEHMLLVATRPSPEPIRAVFTPSQVPGCSPPACTTVYTEDANSPTPASYEWSVEFTADPQCGAGFQANRPAPNQATWYHADESEGGTCNHGGTAYDAQGRGHPATVKVVVTNEAWTCTATYFGTQGDNGSTTGDGAQPEPCQHRFK